MSPADRRAQLRREKLQARKDLSPEQRRLASEKIMEKLRELPEYRDASKILIYRAMSSEVNITLETEGKAFAYPLCTGPGEMIALIPEEGKGWVKNPLGMLEPCRDGAREIAPEEIDLVICPCAGFDSDCNRLGMGKGYYDRYLPCCTKAKKLALAFEVQRCQHVPAENWDVKMDVVLTEKGEYRK